MSDWPPPKKFVITAQHVNTYILKTNEYFMLYRVINSFFICEMVFPQKSLVEMKLRFVAFLHAD